MHRFRFRRGVTGDYCFSPRSLACGVEMRQVSLRIPFWGLLGLLLAYQDVQ